MPLIENTVNNFYETNREKQITKSIRDDISIEKNVLGVPVKTE